MTRTGLVLIVFAICFAGLAETSDARRAPVLGAPGFMGPYGKGWGTVAPETIYNGGVPNGLIESITWRGWGKSVAKGKGLGYQYRPSGGYYAKPVRVRLRAKKLGRCRPGGRLAYTRLNVQMQNYPGGPFGRWFRWSGASRIC